MKKMYKVLTKDKRYGNFVDMLGGEVDYENVYISIYPELQDGQTPIHELKPGEMSDVKYSFNSTTTYAVIERAQ